MSCQLSALTSSASASIAAGVMTKGSDALLVPRHVVLSLVLPPRRNTAPGPKARSRPWSVGFLGREIIGRCEYRRFVTKADEVFGDDAARLVIADCN